MKWLPIIKALLLTTVYLTRWLDEQEQRQLGRNEAIKDALTEMARRRAIARKLDEDLGSISDDDLYKQLRDDFRD